MSTKPTNDAPWDTNGTNMIAPTSGHKTDGFAVDEVPSSSEINGQLNRIGLWTTWLKDGDLELNDVVVQNLTVEAETHYTGIYTKSITGAASTPPTMNSNVDLRGSGNNLLDLYEARISPTNSYAAMGGIVGGTDGREILLTAILPFYLKHEDSSSTAGNRIYLPNEGSNISATSQTLGGPGMLLVPKYGVVRLRYIGTLSRWVVVSLSSEVQADVLYHEMVVPVSAARDFTNSHACGENQITLSTSGNPIVYPIQIPGDYVITGWDLRIDKNTSSGTVTARIYRVIDGSTVAQGSGDSESGNATGVQSLGETGLSITSNSNGSHYLLVTPSSGATPSGDALYNLRVMYESYTQ